MVIVFAEQKIHTEDELTVIEVLEDKGRDFSAKKPNYALKGVSAEVGKQLFHEGFGTKPNGGKTRIQSKHFVCTSCHNTEREDPDLTVSDPQARLLYTDKKGIPFLQGTTMYGAVNRTNYYNGDYFKKYGELVFEARNNVREAIQLCATECAQGRALNDWELESILAYMWTLQFKVEDLGLDSVSVYKLSADSIEALYLSGSPATFIPPPDDRSVGTGLDGDVNNGKLIYENSCLHCHYQGRYSFLHLDNSGLSFKHLNSKIPTYHDHSIYQVIRWGVPSLSGKPSYMPQYPVEKMSDKQLADLRAYIEFKADGGKIEEN